MEDLQAIEPGPQIAPPLTRDDIREFQQIMQDTSGVSMGDAEAWSRATEIVALFRILLGPIPEDPALRQPNSGSNVVRLDGRRDDLVP